MTVEMAEDDGPEWSPDEEIFLWQALLAVAQGRAASVDRTSLSLASTQLFAQDCMAMAVALWEEYETTIEGGP